MNDAEYGASHAGVETQAHAELEAPEREPAGSTSSRAGVKAQLMARLEASVDALLDTNAGVLSADLDDTILEGLNARAPDATTASSIPDGCDLYSLWAAMTALTQEVALQGRAFKDLGETLSPLRGIEAKIDESLAAHKDALTSASRSGDLAADVSRERLRTVARETERRVRKEHIDVLLDMRERLTRGHYLAQEHLTSLGRRAAWRRVFETLAGTQSLAHALQALVDGYSLAVDRLTDALAEWDVRELRVSGRAFDPRTMRAIDIAYKPERADGEVLDVARAGYEWAGDLLRAADVRVNKHPRTGTA